MARSEFIPGASEADAYNAMQCLVRQAADFVRKSESMLVEVAGQNDCLLDLRNLPDPSTTAYPSLVPSLTGPTPEQRRRGIRGAKRSTIPFEALVHGQHAELPWIFASVGGLPACIGPVTQ